MLWPAIIKMETHFPPVPSSRPRRKTQPSLRTVFVPPPVISGRMKPTLAFHVQLTPRMTLHPTPASATLATSIQLPTRVEYRHPHASRTCQLQRVAPARTPPPSGSLEVPTAVTFRASARRVGRVIQAAVIPTVHDPPTTSSRIRRSTAIARTHYEPKASTERCISR